MNGFSVAAGEMEVGQYGNRDGKQHAAEKAGSKAVVLRPERLLAGVLDQIGVTMAAPDGAGDNRLPTVRAFFQVFGKTHESNI